MSVLVATGAGVRHRRSWVFRDLDVEVRPGEIVAVVGPPGSGRTTVLLALAKRFRLSTGEVALSGAAALGHVPGVEQPEPMLTVAEHVRERLALLGRPRREADDVIDGGLYGIAPTLRGWQLNPYQRQLLGLALARLGGPRVIALDGVDDGLDAREQAELWSALADLAESGVAVLVTAREVDPERVATVVRLRAERRDEGAADGVGEGADEGAGERRADGADEGGEDGADERGDERSHTGVQNGARS
jgi:ABC-2 type transport system ATP-binding protein